ncbi:general secretion pathway protein L [Marinobacter daqiaonensis]|uniref:Type II secretion system protein L n=1 Tax=Marinobacter daqiaonensis TaxID=650891 RepID=A0A1I6GPL1_9GAMM|nr:type II secretion system protein GspL [Marinobacter daqiaonensis]SFR44059.1 general secretion pathway protein L [Marinobacter daqiaonensis]
MSYHLYARPVSTAAGTPREVPLFDWLLLDASGEQQARGDSESRESIEDALNRNSLEGVRLIGLIPGDEAMFCFADIPARQARFIRQALPFAVEEQLAQDVDSVHLALGDKDEDGYRVAAIDQQRMGYWLEVYSDWEGAELEAIFPDAALVPLRDHDWAICLGDDLALVASRRGEWMTMRSENLTVFAQTLAMPSEDEVAAEVQIVVYGNEEAFGKNESSMSELVGTSRLSVHRELMTGGTLELLANAHYHHAVQAINLCQGSYAPSHGEGGALREWRPAVAIAAVWFLLLVGSQAGMGYYYQQEADALEAQAMAIYREAFPEDRRATPQNVRRMVEAQFRVAGEQGGDAGFLPLMKYTGQQYSRLPNNQSVVFNSVNYTASRGELVVDVRADSYEKLNTLRSGIAEQGLEASIGSVVNEPEGTRARLTVSGG